MALEFVSIGGFLIVCIGLILTWLKTSRDQGDRDGRIESEINNLNGKMDTIVTSQEKMTKSIQEQAKFCSGFTSRIDQRAIALEKEVFKL